MVIQKKRRMSPHTFSVSRTRSEVPAASTASPEQASNLLVRWTPLLLLSALFVGLAKMASGPIKDPDAWWHLRVGHQFWSGDWSLRDTGPLSSFATEEWTPRDWIPQLLASRIEDRFGLPGVAWLYGVALLVFLFTAYVTCRRGADPLPATIAVLLTVLAGIGSLTQRPQLASFILLFVVVSAWLATSRDLKPRWWIVPLTWVWAGSHGMWYCGVAIGIVTVVGMVLDRSVGLKAAAKLAAIPTLSIAAAALTVVGPQLLLTLFDTTGMWQFVQEWGSPSFRDPSPAIALMMIFVIVATWARRGHAVPWVQISFLVVAVAWILLSKRTVVLGAIVLAPLVAEVVQGWTLRVGRQPLAKFEIGFLAVVTSACLAGLALAVPNSAALPGDVPNALNEELDALPNDASIINAYELGGWLHWRHPELQTVIDGFTDGYTTSDLADYLAASDVEAGWEGYVAETGADLALLKVDAPLAIALVDRLHWISVADDGDFVLLTSPD